MTEMSDNSETVSTEGVTGISSQLRSCKSVLVDSRGQTGSQGHLRPPVAPPHHGHPYPGLEAIQGSEVRIQNQ